MKLPKVYEPGQYESDIYALWEKSGAFRPTDSDKHFSIVMPPPNANGNLHIGHGLTLAIEDVMIRHHRLKGESALFVPGADHAGFETWTVYEKELAKQGKSRFDFSREQLYEQIWDFVSLNKGNYQQQFRQLGASVDWEHYTYTLDEKVVKQAHATFRKMFEQSLIYRAEKLISYCTFHGTGFADIEVTHKEEQGHLWYITYPLTDGSGELTVATARPETLFGDAAVAVHPDDKRYSKFLGKTVKLPLTNREIPVIADDFVDPKFGTGAVKITPAHNQTDFEVGKRHDLPMIRVINSEGFINTDMPEAYRGLTVDEARERSVADLKEQGLLVKTEAIVHSVGHCYKCDTVIQPLLREQWFVDMQTLVKPAIAALKANKISFQPAAKQQQLITYFENTRDWNISRQIAWGIPIPAFQNVDEPDDWIVDERVAEEFLQVGDKTYRRDPDVFDTWFSSSSWPYATLNFPDGEEFKKFYPLSVMESGHDILFAWVSRMIVFGLYNTGEVPFTSVYLHGMIQDEHGQKMSKSKGNVVNPIEKVLQYGSDAFRMGIIADETAGANRPYDESKLVGARNFANKLWNIARYIESLVGDVTEREAPKSQSAADHWVLGKLQQTQERLTKQLDSNRLSEAYDTLYHFVWDDVADWYIEASKAQPNLPLLMHVLESTLLLAHPFAPFLTETIWQTLAWEQDSILAKRTYAEPLDFSKQQMANFTEIMTIVSEVRLILNSLKASGVTLHYTDAPFITDNAASIKQLTRLRAVVEAPSGTGLSLTSTKHKTWLDIDQATAAAYVKDLEEQGTKQAAAIKQLEGRLANKGYVANAPEAIIAQTKAQLTEAKQVLENIEREKLRFS
ncbi:MAG: valS [Candidatus Saccharibacteria bacterium]|nr:valS [Candidatus Saccharibacteria bacterium]